MVRATAPTPTKSTTTYLNTTAKKKSADAGEMTRLLAGADMIPESLASADPSKATVSVPRLKTVIRQPRSTRSNLRGSTVWDPPSEDEVRERGPRKSSSSKRKEPSKEAVPEANEPRKKQRSLRLTAGKVQVADPVNAEIDTMLGVLSPKELRSSRGRGQNLPQRHEESGSTFSKRVQAQAQDEETQQSGSDDNEEAQSNDPRPRRTHKVDGRIRSIAVRPSANDIDEVLEGFDDAASLYGGRLIWAKMLLAAKFNHKPVEDLRTKGMKRFVSLCRQIASQDAALGQTGPSSTQHQHDLVKATKLLERKSLHLLQISPMTEACVHDIFHGAIPTLIYLLQSVANARAAHDTLESNNLEELLDIADLLHQLCVKVTDAAKGAKFLEAGVRGDTRAAVKTSLDQLMEDWQARMNLLEANKKREAYHQRRQQEHARFQRRLQEEKDVLASQLEEHRRKRREQYRSLLANEATLATTRATASGPTTNGHAQIYDIETDFNFDSNELNINPSPVRRHTKSPGATNGYHHSNSARVPQIQTPLLPSLPPSNPPWTPAEQLALYSGLERFTGPNRYEDILNTYSALWDWDVDDLMRWARFFRETDAYEWARKGEVWAVGEKEWLRDVL